MRYSHSHVPMATGTSALRGRLACATTLAAVTAALLYPAPLSAQQAGETVTTPVTTRYDRGPLGRALLGANWRDQWGTTLTLPVLDLDTLGGLTPERTGGRQSRTLHFTGGNGRVYIFRTADKFLHRAALPPDLRNAPVGHVVQDQISMMFPGSSLIVTRIEEALGLLNAIPVLVVMPDDPRLGEFRETYAGLVGMFEENPQEGPDDTPGFAGSDKVVGGDNYIRRLEESGKHRLVAQEYLLARLVDFMTNDTDRGSDNWKFARFPANESADDDGYVWRVVPRDRDFAFIDPGGLFGAVARQAYGKLAQFEEKWPSLRTLTFMTRDMDRRLLASLSRAQWDSVTSVFRTTLTDDVLRSALQEMPDPYEDAVLEDMLRVLQWRRDNIGSIASELFEMVNRHAAVIGSDDGESAEILRVPDGSVRIRLFTDADAAGTDDASSLYFERTFVPSQTSEIRVHLLGGDDRVIIRDWPGSESVHSPRDGILVRIVTGDGDDDIVDNAVGGRTIVYADDAGDRVTSGTRTEVRTAPFDDPYPGRPQDLKDVDLHSDDEEELSEAEEVEAQDVGEKLTGSSYQDFGSNTGFGTQFGHRSGIGILVGAGWSYTQYGFRRIPHRFDASASVLYGVESGRFGVELNADYHPENSRLGLALDARASQFESFRWHGYGNDVERADRSRVFRDELSIRPYAYWSFDNARVGVGPQFRIGKPRSADGTPFSQLEPYGASTFAQAGVAAEGSMGQGIDNSGPWQGVTLLAGGAWYPAALDVAESFGEAWVRARYHLPLGWPTLALRAGAERVWGAFPVHDAAFLGGRHTLRGYATDRFAGDAGIYGGAELHLPLGQVTLLTHTRVGVFGLVDAGRVYMDGESPGGWHDAYGGGLTLETLGRVVTLTWARGETDRVYVELGLPF